MEKISTLIVDDNLAYFESCKTILHVHGENVEVDHAMTAEDCIRKVIQNYYDIVLLDYDLNGTDGIKLLTRIKALNKKLPVIMLVDEGKEEIALEALKNGAEDYIMKVSGDQTALPFTIQKVVERGQVKMEPIQPPIDKKVNATIEQEEKIQEAFYILDRKGHFLSANDKMLAFSGYTEEELMELSVSDLLPPSQEHQFYEWFSMLHENGEQATFTSELVTKFGVRQPVNLVLTSVKNEANEIIGYRGHLKDAEIIQTDDAPLPAQELHFILVSEFIKLLHSSLHEHLGYVLGRIAQIGSQLFKFQKVTLALLDRSKRVFIKQAMVGQKLQSGDKKAMIEVPQELIEQIFTNQFQFKVMYYSHEGLIDFEKIGLKRRLSSGFPPPANSLQIEWQEDDMLLINLVDQNKQTFGYISLEKSASKAVSESELVSNLELFAQLSSLAIENHYHFSMLERKNRRLKQLLVSSNIFKLHLNFDDLLKEVVWSVRYTLDFKLVALALVTSKSGMLEIRAAACDDKIKQLHLEEVRFSLTSIAQVLKDKYKKGKSYFVNEPEKNLLPLKEIYYQSQKESRREGITWDSSALLLVPIMTREQKISGFLLVDDPADGKIPTSEVIHTLEILTNQVAVAIDNRMMYFQMKKRLNILEKATGIFQKEDEDETDKSLGIQRLVKRFLK
ncbi:response regulator [candidate division KSB1 bacterium]|nr:response regulator [candidate division KSB1 bacterium]